MRFNRFKAGIFAGAVLLSGTFYAWAQGLTTSPLLNDLGYALENVAAAIGTGATNDLVLCLDVSQTPDTVTKCSGTNILEVVGTAATAAEITRVADVSARVVSAITTLPVVEATHEGKVVVLNLATGFTSTMPAATGGGAHYTFIVGITITSNNYVFAMTGNDTMVGTFVCDDGDGEPANAWTTTGATTITLGGATNATGGVRGDVIEFWDIATDLWAVRGRCSQGGTEATPFA